MARVSVFACESQPWMIEGVLRVCDSSSDFCLCGTAPNWPAARIGVAHFQPAVVLIDNAAGYRQSALFLAELRTISPRSSAILWVADQGEIELIRSLQVGARGVIRRNQTVDLFCEYLRQVAAGQVWIEPELSGIWAEQSRLGHPTLTPRERDVVQLVTRGLKNLAMAAELGITPGTVKAQLTHVFEKTSAKDRFELASQAVRILGTRQETPINSLAKRQSA